MKYQSLFMSGLIAAIPLAASAQSSVTIYGIVDNGVNYVSNESGGHAVQASSSVFYGNRLGFRGSEDLGDGLSAIFTLENGFDANTGKLGQGGLLFGRQAYAGLSGKFGTVTLGRQYDELSGEYLGLLAAGDIFMGFLGAHAGDVDNLNNTIRINNSIKYKTPTYNGLSMSVLYGFGGVAGNFAANHTLSAGLRYEAGPIAFDAAYEKVDNPGVAWYGAAANPSPKTLFVTGLPTPIWGGYQSAESLQIYGAGVGYSFGPSTVRLVYTNTQFQNVLKTLITPYMGRATFNNYEINYEYRLGAATKFGVGYTYTDAPKAKYQQGNIGVQYLLSKRVILYTMAAYQHASGLNSFGGSAVAEINEIAPSSTSNQFLTRVGMSVKF